MTFTLLPGHRSKPLALDLVIVMTLTLKSGHVTGWPLNHGTRIPFNLEKGMPAGGKTADDILSRVEHLTAQLQNQEEQISDLGTRLAQVTESVSFIVTMSGREVGGLVENQTLKFDKVVLNAGAAYSPHTGLFTTPSAGIYAFHVQVSRHPSDPSGCVEVELVHTLCRQGQGSLMTASRHQYTLPPKRRQSDRLSVPATQADQLPHPPSSPSAVTLCVRNNLTTVLLCVHDDSSASRRVVVRLDEGDTVHAEVKSGSRLLGDAFTSLTGLKLLSLAPQFRLFSSFL